MMTFNETIKVGKKYVKYMEIPKCVDDHKENIIKAFATHGKKLVEVLVKKTARGSRTGRTYSYKGKRYIASAIYEPPQSVSGKLNKSFRTQCNIQRMIVGNTAFSKGVPYPFLLEVYLERLYFTITNEDYFTDLQTDLQRITLSV